MGRYRQSQTNGSTVLFFVIDRDDYDGLISCLELG